METTKTLNASVLKAIGLLNYFSQEKPSWGVRELATATGANQSTTYRLMASLASQGILQQNPETEKYHLGLKLFELGNRVNIKTSLVNITHPCLQKVTEEIKETVHLGVLQAYEVLMVDKIASPMGLQLKSSVGMYSPAYCTGIGKMLLAYLSDREIKAYLKHIPLVKRTSFTIASKSKLKKELKKIKEQSFAIDRQELELGLICVAVPVFNAEGKLIAAMSAAGPADRFREEAIEDYVAILTSGAREIQEQIGTFNF
jgi:IclR family KDG regulon transcriptional repressor